MKPRFDVAFSLAGEQRSFIEPVAAELERRGRTVFFYGWPRFQAQLAAPHLDKQLRQIYGTEAHLIVPVLSADYARKPWTDEVEFTVVRELIFDGRNSVMALRADDTPIEGFSKLHGYIDLRGRSPNEIADLIELRLSSPGLTQPSSAAEGRGAGLPTAAVTVPPLPRWVVERGAEMASISEVLVSSVHDSSALAIAIVGMPGIGKTTLLKMLAQPGVRPPELDEVVWVTAGREVRGSIALLREAAIGLGARPEDFQHDEVVATRCRELFQRRRVLIALDDVWRKEQVEPFLVAGSGSRVVFTTRDRGVGIALAAAEVRLDTLDPDQAVRLIRLWAGRESDQFADIARRLGYHPLALRLAGIQLQDAGLSPAQWLAEFNRLSQLKLGRATQDKNEDILVCFALSLERLAPADQQLYYSLGIFPFQAVVPQATILRFWRHLGRQPDQVREMLREFELSGLLDVSPGGVLVHDLLRQYAREQLGDSSRTLHKLLLQSYGATSDQSMPKEADGYYQAFSAYHLREARVHGAGAKFAVTDILGWALLVFGLRSRRRALPGPPPVTPTALPEVARIALMGSWGTGLYGAPVIAQSILASAPYDLVLHLGDIYRSGTVKEVRTQFLRFWPTEAARVSRAMNGNHEMYSGGVGYFDHLLPAFGQSTSYFAFANTHWLLVCLDSAYLDADLGREQRNWLRETVASAGTRRIVMFSHHFLFSPFESRLPKFRAAIADALPRPATAWYWAHEHACIVFDPAAEYGGVRARCMGHGGFPNARRPQVRRLPTESAPADVEWKRFQASDDHPSGLILDGPNPYLVGREDKFSPHGYATIRFDGPTLLERVHLADARVIWENTVVAD